MRSSKVACGSRQRHWNSHCDWRGNRESPRSVAPWALLSGDFGSALGEPALLNLRLSSARFIELQGRGLVRGIDDAGIGIGQDVGVDPTHARARSRCDRHVAVEGVDRLALDI